MSKWKINPNFFALILVASLFAEWKYMILLAFLVFVLWHENEKLRKLSVQVVAISSACALFMLFWNVVESGFSVIDTGANALDSVILLFDDMYTRPEWLNTLLSLLNSFEGLLYNLVSLAIYFAKFSFIIAVITGTEPKKGIFGKIYNYLNTFSSFVDKKLYDLNTAQPVNPMPAANPAPTMPAQPVAPVENQVQNNNMTM